MFTKKQIAILIAVGLVLLAMGVALGIFLPKPLALENLTKIKAANNLSSKVVSSIVAYGQVESINGRDIILSNLGDNLAISISNSAKVYSFVIKKGATAPVQQPVEFENIKVGDKVNVAVKILPSGQLEGSSVIILPVSSNE